MKKNKQNSQYDPLGNLYDKTDVIIFQHEPPPLRKVARNFFFAR